MRDLTRTFTLFSRVIFDDFDTQAGWHLAKSITKFTTYSVLILTSFFLGDWYRSKSYRSPGCQFRESILHIQKSPDCPDKEIFLISHDFIQYMPSILLTLVLWEMTLFLRKKHQQDWKRLKSQSLIEKKSNLTELSREAKILKDKYGSLYEIKKSQTPHPDFLCEPGTHELMDLPPVVSCDGYARGFTQFVLTAGQDQNSAPFGIIDQPLLGDLLAYIQNQPLSTATVFQPDKLNVLKTIKMMISLLQNLVNKHKDVGRKMLYRYALFYTGLYGYLCIKKSDSSLLEFVTWNILLIPLMVEFIKLYGPLMHFYESKILCRPHEYASPEELKNELNNLRLITVSSLFVCPLTQALLDKAVICQDGNIYEEKIIKQHFNFKKNATIRSPISRTEFKDYPLMWPYHQRRKQIQKLTRANYFNLTR